MPTNASMAFEPNSPLPVRTVMEDAADFAALIPWLPGPPGVIEGDADPHQLIPQLIEMWQEGRFPFDRIVRQYSLEQLATALEDFHPAR